MIQHSYLIGLGCNIAPGENMALMVKALLPHVSTIILSRVLTTPPVGMNSPRYFLNCVAYIETPLNASELKILSNQIEIAMGRDRTDPDSKHKDRPADIDILCIGKLENFIDKPARDITNEYFLFPVIEELQAFLADKTLPVLPDGVMIDAAGLFFGQSPATIYRDTDAGQKRVL